VAWASRHSESPGRPAHAFLPMPSTPPAALPPPGPQCTRAVFRYKDVVTRIDPVLVVVAIARPAVSRRLGLLRRCRTKRGQPSFSSFVLVLGREHPESRGRRRGRYPPGGGREDGPAEQVFTLLWMSRPLMIGCPPLSSRRTCAGQREEPTKLHPESEPEKVACWSAAQARRGGSPFLPLFFSLPFS